MRYLIIGLGIYGSNLAKDLTDMGHEVIAADIRPANVEAIKEYVSTTYILDSSDAAALAALPLKNVDLVIVAIGENFGASVKTVALLRKLGVENLYARAIDDVHRAILQALQVKRILDPEQRAAHDLVNEMVLGTDLDALQVDNQRYVMCVRAPRIYAGMLYSSLAKQRPANLELICASRPREERNAINNPAQEMEPLFFEPDSDERIEEGDRLTFLGTMKDFRALARHLAD